MNVLRNKGLLEYMLKEYHTNSLYTKLVVWHPNARIIVFRVLHTSTSHNESPEDQSNRSFARWGGPGNAFGVTHYDSHYLSPALSLESNRVERVAPPCHGPRFEFFKSNS